LENFVDNTPTLAIERVFLRDLPDLILSSCEPLSLSDEQLEAVAGESEKAKEQRTKAVHRIATLEAVVQACRQYKGINRSTTQKAMSSRTSTTPQKDTPGEKVTKD
jgi:5'-deoxynucleotidase YfbR-like HD superfamily hydrolase